MAEKHGWTHTYDGPSTKWGLIKGCKCKIIGKRAGGKLITVDKHYGKTSTYIVNKAQLKTIPVNERK